MLAAKILKKISRKSNGNLQNFETFHEFLANFGLKTLFLIKIKASLMEFWNSFIILKEIKKSICKFLRVWEKNQLTFEFFEKILKFTYKISMENWFLPIFSPIFRDFCRFIHLWNISTFWGLVWGSSAWLGGFFRRGVGVCINPCFKGVRKRILTYEGEIYNRMGQLFSRNFKKAWWYNFIFLFIFQRLVNNAEK